jgi:geranylgeranyl diphosphate synthase type II
VANKKTFLTIKAFMLAKGNSLELLNSYFKVQNIDPLDKIKGVLKIYDEVGVKELTETKINEFYQNALKAVEKISVKPEKKDVLICLAKKIMDRDS